MNERLTDTPDAQVYDVIIVGAGPTGLTLANLLGLEGVSVLVVERNETTVQEPRAVSIDDESLRTVQATGLLSEIMTQVVPGYGSRYLSPDGSCFLTVLPSGQPYGHPRRNAFRQPVFESQLRAGLNRFPNVRTAFGWTMSAFSQDHRGVTVNISRAGTEQHVKGSYLVGTDGASSLVRKQLDIPLEGKTLPERWLIVDLENSPAERNTVVYCNADRPCIALPGPNLTRRFEFKLFESEDKEALLNPVMVDELLKSHGVALQSKIVRKTVYTFHARVAKTWCVGRVFLAGDAAHLTPPFAGQGMNSGIRDVHNLAWKLAAVVKGRLNSGVLETYETERSGHVARMIELALHMGRIMGPPNHFIGWMTQTAFKIAGLWPPLRSYFGEMKYKPKPRFEGGFLVPSNHPLVGRLLAQPLVKDGKGQESLLDDVLTPGFVLLGWKISSNALIDATQHSIWNRLNCTRTNLNPENGTTNSNIPGFSCAETALDCDERSILLIRPDRYVMAVFKPQEAGQIIDQLTQLMSHKAAYDAQQNDAGIKSFQAA